MTLVLPAFDMVNADDAIAVYYSAGLRPILIHAPAAEGKCSCGEQHKANGKHPIAKNWQKPATLDDLQDQLSRLKFKPNVGIVLGRQQAGEYLVAIDIDDEARAAVIEEELGKLPETVRCDSGRGYRLFYELGPEIPADAIRNVTGLRGEPGVDVKVSGGQVVVSPSLHVNGKRYRWTQVGPIAKLPSAWGVELIHRAVPDWAREYTPQDIRDDKRTRTRVEKYLATSVRGNCIAIASAGVGMRNNTLYAQAVSLFSLANGMHLTIKWGEISRELQAAAKAAGLQDKETLRTIASAEHYVRSTGQVRVPVALTDPGTSPGIAPDAAPAANDPLATIRLQDDRGSPAKTAGNIAVLLAQHPIWNGGPMFDSYSHTVIWPEAIPSPISSIHRSDREIVDADHAAIQEWLMSLPTNFRVRTGIDAVVMAVHLASARKSIDLLKQWVEALPPWDETDRLDTWTTKYLGCADDAYSRATGRAWLVAAIERALIPGINVDVAPVLEGEQKSGKNRALETLFAGGPAWAPWICMVRGDTMDSDNNKRIACGRWILHDDEMRAREPKYLDAIKSWHSRTQETFRIPYSKEITVAKRRGLLVTSTNLKKYLHDDTGNRRWWPWATKKINIGALEKDRIQLLSEALAAVRVGKERWRDHISDAIYKTTLEESDGRRVLDPLLDQLEMLLTSPDLAVLRPKMLTTQGLGTAIGYSSDKMDRGFEMRVASAMRELGYTKDRVQLEDGTRIRHFVKVGRVGQKLGTEV